MRLVVLVLAGLAIATPVLAQTAEQQPVQVVTPTYVQDHACYQPIPCETPAPPCPTTREAPCQQPAVAIHYVMRSKSLFWGGAVIVAGGAALVTGAFTWGRESVPVAYPTAPCGVDPYTTRLAIAPCQTSGALLAAGLSIASAGGFLMFYGGQHVAVGADGRSVKVTVRF